MSVRTAHWEPGLLFVSHGTPHPEAAVALADNGLVFSQGSDRWLVAWTDLDSVRAKAKGTLMADQPRMIVGAVGLVRWTFNVFAVVLAILTFGGLGGGGWQSRRGLEITPILRNQPPAFATTYAVGFSWPRHPTDLEKHWFIDVFDALSGRDSALDVAGLANLLENAHSRPDLHYHLPEVVTPGPRTSAP